MWPRFRCKLYGAISGRKREPYELLQIAPGNPCRGSRRRQRSEGWGTHFISGTGLVLTYFTGIQVKDCQSSGGENVQVFQSTFAFAGGEKPLPSIRLGVTSVSSTCQLTGQDAPPSGLTILPFSVPTYPSPFFFRSMSRKAPALTTASGKTLSA